MSDTARQIMSRLAPFTASSAHARQQSVYRLLNHDVTRLLEVSDNRDPTCDICADDEERMQGSVMYLKHLKCGRSCHASCLFEYLQDESCCLCPYCRACLKSHSLPDECVLWEEPLEPNNIGNAENTEAAIQDMEEQPRNFHIGLHENGIPESDHRWDMHDFEVDSVGWLGEVLHGNRDYATDYRGPPDRVFNEINSLSTSSRYLHNCPTPPEILGLRIDSRASRAGWLRRWNVFISELQHHDHRTLRLNDVEVLYDYCDSITTAFMNLRARENLADLLHRWELIWLEQDGIDLARGRYTDVMLARRHCLFVPGNGQLKLLAAGNIQAAIQQLMAEEDRIQRQWELIHEVANASWEAETESARELLIVRSKTLWAELQAIDSFPPLPEFTLPLHKSIGNSAGTT